MGNNIPEKTEQKEYIYEQVKLGRSQTELAEALNLSRQRVNQIWLQMEKRKKQENNK